MEATDQAKARLFGFLLGRKELGLNRHGCFNGMNAKGQQIRYNFRDPKVLKFEEKVPTTPEEKKIQPLINSKWVAKESQAYEKVKMVADKLVLTEEPKQKVASK